MKMAQMMLGACLLAMILGLNATHKDYTGYEILRIHAGGKSDSDAAVISSLLNDKSLKVELWNEIKNKSVIDIQVPPESMQIVQDALTSNDMKFEVDIRNIQEEIDRETEEEIEAEEKETRRKRLAIRRAKRWSNRKMPAISFDIVGKYVDLPKMATWMREIQNAYPTLVDLIYIGNTTEGREMTVVKIGKGSGNKPAIWIDANIHAREWITSATANYIINKLVTEFSSNRIITNLLEYYDWYILPVINPDGFQYSHTTDRLWRKTRSKQSDGCYGVDPNRNWDFHWADCCKYTARECSSWYDAFGCGSNEPCNNLFFGSEPFSEPEALHTANFILSKNDTLKLYLSLHSYSQLWLQTWGYTKTKPKDYPELDRVAKVGVDALQAVHNTTYVIGSPPAILYAAAGGSSDWAKGVAGIKYSYTLELRDTGKHGFLLPMEQIIPTGEETWAAIQAVALDRMLQ